MCCKVYTHAGIQNTFHFGENINFIELNEQRFAIKIKLKMA